jgi:hypothetical protein
MDERLRRATGGGWVPPESSLGSEVGDRGLLFRWGGVLDTDAWHFILLIYLLYHSHELKL